MKKSEAVEVLKSLMHVLQKARSNAAEELGFGSDAVMTKVISDLMPYTYSDEKGILPAVLKVLDKFENTGELVPLDFVNLMYLVDREDALGALFTLETGEDIPAPNFKLVSGWESE